MKGQGVSEDKNGGKQSDNKRALDLCVKHGRLIKTTPRRKRPPPPPTPPPTTNNRMEGQHPIATSAMTPPGMEKKPPQPHTKKPRPTPCKGVFYKPLRSPPHPRKATTDDSKPANERLGKTLSTWTNVTPITSPT